MKIRMKQLYHNAQLPQYANPGDAGLDLFAYQHTANEKYIEYTTGIAVEIPPGYVGLLCARSSISNRPLFLCNGVGILDSEYRGEIAVRFKRTDGHRDDIYQCGEKIAQLIIVPHITAEIEWVDSLSDTQRGVGGFGSTGK